MSKYKYKAISSKGEVIQGVHECRSREEVLNLMVSSGYSPLSIEEAIGSKEIILGNRNKVNNKDISIFCRQLATMIEAGVSITNAIGLLAEQIPNKKLREVLVKVDEDIRKGEELSVAMGKYSNEFPDLLISMIQVGEQSGTLDSIMNRMATYYEKQTKMNGKLKNALIYPGILATVTVFVVVFILTYIMPMFMDMFESAGSDLPAMTKIVLSLGDGIRHYGILIGLIIVGTVVGFKYYTTRVDAGIYMYSKYKLKKSLFKDLNQKIVVSRFARGLSTVLGAGLSIASSIDVVSAVLENKYAYAKLKTVKERMLVGDTLSDAIKESQLFPPMLGSMIKIGEEAGELDNILSKTADFYDEELERTIEAFTTILDPIMLVIMGVVVGFLIISILTPMFEMYNVM
ncbi:type II secretion system F family protein [Clostridium sp. UBA7503]|uniref:type II secretion system F family protein n=1 Tax=Clostridium sp. UBA7503 TaxID=1946377 RepID=UPI0032173662